MRNQIVHHGAGKGDKSRVDDEASYQANLEAIKFSGRKASEDEGFEKKGGKFVKTYGPKQPEPHEKFNTKIIVH